MKKTLNLVLRMITWILGLAFLATALRALMNPENMSLVRQAISLGILAVGIEILNQIKVILFKNQLLSSMKSAVEGNLARKIFGLGEYEEVGKLAAELNKNTKSILSETCGMAQRISNLSGDISSIIGQQDAATQHIALSIHEMAQGASDQLASTMQIRDNMDLILSNSESINQNSDETLEIAQEMGQVVEKNTQVFGYVIDKLRTNAESNERILHRIEDLQKEARKINEITNAVTEISDKTNILSLNASIEAARAGEHGRGFAVVAEEVRNLAQQSAEEAKQIKIIIDSINISIKEIADDSRESFDHIQEDIEYADQAKQSSEGMVEASQKTYASIEKIKDDSSNTYDIVSSTNDLFEEITETTRKSAAFSEQVSATTQEQAASMANSLEIIKELNRMAERSEEGIQSYISNIVITDKMKKDIADSFSILEEIGKEINSKNADIRNYSDVLKQYKEREKAVEYIGILDARGEMVSAADPIDKSNNMYNHRPYFIEAMKGHRSQSDPYISNVTYGYCTAIAIPYKRANGEIAGVIMADINIES